MHNSRNKKIHCSTYINFILYFSQLIYIGFCVNILTSIQVDITYAYGYSTSSVIYTSSADLFGAITISFFNFILIERMGIRWSLIISSIGTTICSWTRIILPHSITIVIIGFIFCGLGVGFALNTILKFCEESFPPKKRPFYYSFMTLGSLLGSGLGPIMPYLFIKAGSEKVSKEQKGQHIMLYLWIITIFATIHFFLIVIFLRIKKSFPQYEDLNRSKKNCETKILKTNKKGFWKELCTDTKSLFKNLKFLKILSMITISKGNFMLLNTILVIIITNLGYNKIYGSLTIVIGLIFGLIGSVIYSKKFVHLKDQQFFLSLYLLISLIILIFGYVCIVQKNIIFFIILYSISSLFSYPLIPMYFNLASKEKFNASLSSVNSYMMLCPQLFTLILQLISSWCFKAFESNGSYIIFLFLIFLYFVSFYILRFLKV